MDSLNENKIFSKVKDILIGLGKVTLVFFTLVSIYGQSQYKTYQDKYNPVPVNNIHNIIKYPIKAKETIGEGTVRVKIYFDKHGKYESHDIISSPNKYLSQEIDDNISLIKVIGNENHKGIHHHRFQNLYDIDFRLLDEQGNYLLDSLQIKVNYLGYYR